MNSGAFRISINERDFIHEALRAEQRVDGRRPFDVRRLKITFAKQDGSVEVVQGQTRVMAVVTGQLGPPYPDRPTEGSLAIFTEFSPMADPSFEPGRPGEMAIELGRIIDRGLRESRAVDMESLCVLAGQKVWAIRVDIHILDNGGNLVDVANIAALAALMSYRRPECTVGGHNGQEVTVHPPEVREPVSLIIHHLPIAVTFAFFSGDLQVVDPSLKEEAVMGGRLTVTVNAQGDICAIQKGGGIGVSASEIMRCIRIASSKASEITNQVKQAVEANKLERSTRKIKRHSTLTFQDVTIRKDAVRGDTEVEEVFGSSAIQAEQRDAMMELIKEEEMEESSSSESEDDDDDEEEEDLLDRLKEKKQKLEGDRAVRISSVRNGAMESKPQTSRKAQLFEGGPSFWDDDEDMAVSTQVSKTASKRTSKKPFDSDALAEFSDVADVISKAVVKTQRVTTDGSQDSTVATMSAAAVYAKKPQQRAHVSKPLGPFVPQTDDMNVDDKKVPLGSLEGLSGVELKPAPTSLLDAVKKKRKEKKKL
ncbi:unnamed protein product [Calypogeia fissa]